MEVHPKGSNARVLLSSVFGPYAQDDEFGSRAINPMELYQNQVTRAQGAFSPRIFHRSWGIMMIQENISAPCTVLDFPTREAFARELTSQNYDVVGISSIIVNVGKVREMCRMVRQLSPQSKIIVGGHVAAIPGIAHMIDADHIVQGEGISWMRRYLGEDPNAPDTASADCFRIQLSRHGAHGSRETWRCRGDDHSLRRLSHRLQLLHHLLVLRRQGEIHQFLRDRA